MSAGDELAERWEREMREAVAVMTQDQIEMRARRLCREAEPHGQRGTPCPACVVEARRQLGAT